MNAPKPNLLIFFLCLLFTPSIAEGLESESYSKPNLVSTEHVQSRLKKRLNHDLSLRKAKRQIKQLRKKTEKDNQVIHPKAITGLMLGLAGTGILISLLFFAAPEIVFLLILYTVLSLLALVFSSMALNEINKKPGKFKGRGLAILGMLLGVLGIAFFIYAWIASRSLSI
ncbi:MAG: DUF4190 domain-containing protein [Saprospiraceae bacterium]